MNSYFNYGNINQREKNKLEGDLFPLADNIEDFKYSSNPFEDVKKNKSSLIQIYFNQKYSKISAYVKSIVARMSLKGETKTQIDEAIIEFSALLAQYAYNKTLPNNSDKKCIAVEEGKGRIFEIRNYENKMLKSAVTDGFVISKIFLFFEKDVMCISFQSKSLLDKILKFDNLLISKWEMFDKEGNLEELMVYNKKGKPMVFHAYENNREYMKLVFDVDFDAAKNSSRVIPLEYTSYDTTTQNVFQTLTYFYSRPFEYREYNISTSKLSKVFKLQGLENCVYRYAFYNGATGQLVTSGNL